MNSFGHHFVTVVSHIFASCRKVCYFRLAKRWVAAQLLCTSVPDTAVEVIMARVFLVHSSLGM
jgi:hypothetical protein